MSDPDEPRARATAAGDVGGQGPLAVWRIEIAGGLTAILCCVGPTVLAILGVVSAGTALVWATDLNDGYAWWFPLAVILVLAALVNGALRRHTQCSLTEVRSLRNASSQC